MKTTILSLFSVLTIALSASAHASAPRDPFASVRKDDCARQVISIANGLNGMWAKSRIIQLELDSATDTRSYILAIDSDGSIDTYEIELTNDSSFKCLIVDVTLTQSGA